MKKFKTLNYFNFEKNFKLLLIMKLILFFLITGFIQVSATVYSQNTKFTFDVQNKRVVDVLREIEDQSNFRFFYQREQVNVEKKIDLKAADQTVENILTQIFPDGGIEFSVRNDDLILLKPVGKSMGAYDVLFAGAQQHPVSGVVFDSFDRPLPGVTILIKGTTHGTISGADGTYHFPNLSESSTLVFSFVGMKTQEVLVGSQTVINVTMEEEIIGIEEVVAVGYGVQKKVNLTGSVASVTADEISNRSLYNVAQAVQGMVPNLQISTTDGGRPGSNFSWTIRGAGTLGSAGASGAPLFIVDGVTADPNELNPDDIESISILKDAAAAAIYGSRAPFGVVLITTKRGKSEQMKVTVNSSLGWRSLTKNFHPMGSLDYAHYTNEGYTNRGAAPVFNEEYLEAIQYHIDHPESPTRLQDPANPLSYYRNVATDENWWRNTYRDGALTQNYNISATGGSKAVTYYLSLGALNQEGQYRYGDDVYKRYNGMLNLNVDATSWMEIAYKLQYARRENDTPTTNSMDWMQMTAFRGWPILPLIDPNGYHEYFGAGIQEAIEGGRRNDLYESNRNTLTFIIKPVKGLRLNGEFAYNTTRNIIQENTKVIYTHDPLGNIKGTQQGADKSSILEHNINTTFYSINTYADYNTSYGKHNFNLLGGFQQEYYYNFQLKGYNYDLISEEIHSLMVATGADKQLTDWKGEWATQGFFGRFNYNYDEKYLFELNGRYDGSSRFPKDFRWGFFPSASVGYVISKESFFTPLKTVVDFMKFRASYGRLGNTNVDLYYSAAMSKGLTNYLGPTGTFLEYVSIPALGNYNLTWEKPTTLNLAVDLGFLQNRLQTSFDWYTRTTYDMVGPSEPLASVLGIAVPNSNNTELQGKGWELNLNYKDRIKKDFTYQLGFNIARHRETVLKYYNPTGVLTTHYAGKVMGEIWGYETVGLIQDQETLDNMADQSYFNARWGLGDVQYKDQNDDKKINQGLNTLEDHGDLVIIGNSTPAYEYNFTISSAYKGFDFRVFFSGIGKTDWWPAGGQGYRTSFGASIFRGYSNNQFNHSVLEEHKDHWTPDNPNGYYPRVLIGSNEGNKNFQVQTRFLQNRAFLRMKNIQFGYTLPSKLTKPIMIQNARFYFSGENLLTFTKLMIFDPETPGYIYPLQKVVTTGLNITF